MSESLKLPNGEERKKERKEEEEKKKKKERKKMTRTVSNSFPLKGH